VTEDQLALVLLGAFWAGTTSVYTGIKNTNEVRDRIVTGKVGVDLLPIPYLWRLFLLDWLPLKLSLAFVSLTLGVIILLLPTLRRAGSTQEGFTAVCYVAAAMPFIGFLFQTASCVIEGLYLRDALKRAERERAASPPTGPEKVELKTK
jgi:hypothetical protein